MTTIEAETEERRPVQLAAAAERLSSTMRQSAAVADAAKHMSLANVVGGAVKKPPRLLVYGVDGVGKSTLASCAPAPIFLGSEDGTATLDVKRFPVPRNWLDALTAVDILATSEHSYQTLVIDSLDWLEPLCWHHVVSLAPRLKSGAAVESIEDIPFGGGYVDAVMQWRFLLSKLDALRAARGMAIVLIAHSTIVKYANPEGDDFERFELKLQASKKASTAGLIREWCDAVLFATYETYTHKPGKDPKARAKGVSTGARILHTQRAAAFDAKNRYNLPAVLPLEWSSLVDAIDAGQSASSLRARIEARLDGQAVDLVSRVRAAVAAAGDDSRTLVRIENKLAAMLTIEEKEAIT